MSPLSHYALAREEPELTANDRICRDDVHPVPPIVGKVSDVPGAAS